jgi:serine/threonine-protein kinase RsbW
MALNESSQSEHSLKLNSDLSECKRLYQFLADFAKQHELADDILHDLKLAAEEIFANIVIHGYKKTAGHVIDISIATHRDHIDISFSDEASAYNPLDASNKPGNKDDCCEGGMGLHIIQSVTDEQSYNRIDNRNVFIITKHYTIQK